MQRQNSIFVLHLLMVFRQFMTTTSSEPHTAHCIVCNNPVQGFTLGSTSLIRCSGCGLVASASIPTDEEREQYYTHSYSLTAESAINRSIAEMRRWSRLPEQLKLLQDIEALKSAPATILDIGCDKAYFLDEARRYGYNVVGVEPSQSARIYASSIGIPVYTHIHELHQKFDIAVLWHSLEHSGNPMETITKVYDTLSDDGIIAIRVPDFGSFWSKLLKHRWLWFQPGNHYYHFTQTALTELVQKAGFSVVSVQSQRPNTMLTLRSGMVAIVSFVRYASLSGSMRLRLSQLYQYITGIELYIIARKEQ